MKTFTIFMLVFMAFAVIAKAQSLPAYPYEGATHTYVVNGLTPGVGYTFFMALQADGSEIVNDLISPEFDFLDVTSGTVPEGESTASVPIKWGKKASLHVYFLTIRLTNPGGCSTNRFLRIVPQVNAFDILSENVPTDNTESCPNMTADNGFNPSYSAYNSGSTTLLFKVRREGGNRNWSFEPVVTVAPDLNQVVTIISVTKTNGDPLDPDGSNIYKVPAVDNEVFVTLKVSNCEGIEQKVTFGIRNQQEEKTWLIDGNNTNDQVKHRILIIPVISDLEEI